MLLLESIAGGGRLFHTLWFENLVPNMVAFSKMCDVCHFKYCDFFSCEKKKWSIIIPAKAWWCCSSLCGICVGTRCLLVKQNTFLTVLFWVWDQSCQSYKSTFSALWLKWPLMFAVCNMSGIILCGTHWLFTSAQMNLYICCFPSLLTQHTSCLNTCVEQDAYFIWLMKCMTQ